MIKSGEYATLKAANCFSVHRSLLVVSVTLIVRAERVCLFTYPESTAIFCSLGLLATDVYGLAVLSHSFLLCRFRAQEVHLY